MFGDYINLHHYGEGKLNNEKFYISDSEFNACIENIKKEFPDKNIGSLSNKESNDTYFFVAPDMEIVGLSNDDYFSLGNIKEMDTQELLGIKQFMKDTLMNAKKNRAWTIKIIEGGNYGKL